MGKSKIKRRSGTAFVECMKLYKWIPTGFVQVGVGNMFEEVDCVKEQWPDCQVIGFEADPRNCETVKYPGVLYHEAVGAEVGRTGLFTRTRYGNGSSVFEHNEKKNNENFIEVPMTTLDHALAGAKIGDAIALWLDCEGSELAALMGSEEFINKVSVINVEMTGIPRGAEWCRPVDVHRWLVEHNFIKIWYHTLRGCIAQADAIYMRREMVKPELSLCQCEFV